MADTNQDPDQTFNALAAAGSTQRSASVTAPSQLDGPVAQTLPAADSSDDLSVSFRSAQDDRREAAKDNQFKALVAGHSGIQPAGTPTPVDMALVRGATQTGSTIKDLATGITEIPRAGIKAARDFSQEALDLADDVVGWTNANNSDLHQIVAAPEDTASQIAHQVSNAKLSANAKSMLRLPDISPPQSVTGGVVKSVAQFLMNYAALGALPGVGAAGSAAEKSGGVAKAVFSAAKGGVANAVTQDPHQSLSDLLVKFPALRNPVTQYLSSHTNDTEADGRFKNALEGFGLGLLTEGFFTAVKSLRSANIARQLNQHAMLGPNPPEFGAAEPPPPEPIPPTPEEISDQQLGTLGDPANPRLVIDRAKMKIDPQMDAAEGVTPQAMREGAKDTNPQMFINWARINSRDDIKKLIQHLADSMQEPIENAQRGVQTWERTRVSAAKENAFKLLIDRAPGGTFNAEQTLAVRELWVSSGQKLSELANISVGAPTETNLFAFRRMLATHYAIQQEVMAARTEAARALNAWAIPAGSNKLRLANIQSLIDGFGGRNVNLDLATRVAQLAVDPIHAEAMEKLVEGSVWAKTADAIKQAFMNGLLSSPSTHLVIQASSFVTAAQQVFERTIAGYIGKAIGTQGGVELGEGLAMMHGQVAGFKDALRALRQSIGKGFASINPTSDSAITSIKKVMMSATALTDEAKGALAYRQPMEVQPGAFSPEVWGMANETPMGQALNYVDVGTQAPGRLIQLGHEIHKMAGYRMELQAQALRQATRELQAGSLTQAEVGQRVAEIVANPPHDVQLAAVDQALYQTFTQKPAELLNGFAKAWQRFPIIGRLTLPFKNTPINIMTYALERTPMAPLMSGWQADIAAGGARADLALARMATGSLTMAAVMDLALRGQVTGGGHGSPGAEALSKRQGDQPYSIRIGDHLISYNRIHPIGMTIGMAADIAEIMVNLESGASKDKQVEQLSAAFMASIAHNMTSHSYLKGMSDLMDAMEDKTGRKMDKLVQGWAGAVVPAGVSAIARQQDPYMKVVGSMADAIKSKSPMWNKDLPLVRDLWGRPIDIRSTTGPNPSDRLDGYDLWIPAHLGFHHSEPIDDELKRIQHYPDMPPKKEEFKPLGAATPAQIDLESFPKAYSRYCELAGNALKLPQYEGLGAKDYLNKLVAGNADRSPIYEKLSNGPDPMQNGKAGMISKVISDFRTAARQKLLEEFPEVKADYEIKKRPIGAKWDPSIFGGSYPTQ